MADIALPRLANGSVDWDRVFDTPGTGLIAQIEHAQTAKDLQQGMHLVLKTLFNREGDANRRAVFTNLVNEILANAKKTRNSPAAIMTDVKTRVVQILHSIKHDRVERARKAQAAKARKERDSGAQASANPGLDNGPSAPDESLGYDDRQPDEVRITIPKPVSASAQDELIENDSTDEESADTEPPKDEPGEDEPFVDASGNDGSIETPTDDDIADWLANTPKARGADEYDDTGDGERKLPNEFFIDLIVTSILQNLAVLRGDLTDGGSINGKLPFVLSPAFATLFESVLREHVMPEFSESSYFTVSQMSSRPRSKWLSTLTEIFSDPTQGLMLWERWQIAWRNATTQRDNPPAPEVDPAKKGFRGVMSRMLGSDDVFIAEVELTQDEWVEAVKESRRENLRAQKIWSLLTAESDIYHPPQDRDNHLLMELFRTNEDVESHVTKLRQFAKDGETAGRAFDAYLPGKDLDLPLLCACYRYPDEFMTGEKAMVATFVAGLDRRRGEATLPLCCRHLGAAMGNRFAED